MRHQNYHIKTRRDGDNLIREELDSIFCSKAEAELVWREEFEKDRQEFFYPSDFYDDADFNEDFLDDEMYHLSMLDIDDDEPPHCDFLGEMEL